MLVAPDVCLAQREGQSPANVITDGASDDDRDLAKVYGLLAFRSVSVDFDRVPVREALDAIKRQARLPMTVRWNTDPMGMGIDPNTPISLTAEKMIAQDALEVVLEQCDGISARSECTWQIRRGFIEVGTKQRLAVPAARTMRLYDVSDLLIEPPDFGGGGRKTPLEMAVELVEQICETIEPGRWDFGQAPPLVSADDERLIRKHEGPTTAAGTGSGEPAATQPADANPPPPSAPADAPAQGAQPAANQSAAPASPNVRWNWASIRVWRGQLLVVAPDFMHRQIGGYPEPIAPDDLATDDSATTPTSEDTVKSRGKGRQP